MMTALKESLHTLMTRKNLRNAHAINKSYIVNRKWANAFSNAFALTQIVNELTLQALSAMMGNMSTTVNERQLAAIKNWAAEGMDLNGIQKKLQSEFGLHLTFMEVRFLMLDHGIELVQETAPAAEPNELDEKAQDTPAEKADGSVRVELDDLQLPGTLLSGKAHSPGGVEGAWQIDQLGRFGWSQLTGTPSPEEMQSFQQELTAMLRRA